LLKELGHEVIVANARRVALIAKNVKKSDEVDAELLARLARSDEKLLSPIEHCSKEHQKHMTVVRSRDALVRARTMLVNHVRGIVKSFGGRLPSTATRRFHKLEEHIPPELAPALSPVMATIRDFNTRIGELDGLIEELCREEHPETDLLRGVPGVGPVTALVFALAIGDPNRFKRNRDVGAYLGLVPRKRQSGDEDPQLRITRAGNVYMRRLLVNAAHYVLGPFGPDSKLRRFGLAIAARGGKRAKKRAVVAVARKLAVLLISLWKNGEIYESFPGTRTSGHGLPDEQISSPVGASAGPDICGGVAFARRSLCGQPLA
jgi:transposase